MTKVLIVGNPTPDIMQELGKMKDIELVTDRDEAEHIVELTPSATLDLSELIDLKEKWALPLTNHFQDIPGYFDPGIIDGSRPPCEGSKRTKKKNKSKVRNKRKQQKASRKRNRKCRK